MHWCLMSDTGNVTRFNECWVTQCHLRKDMQQKGGSHHPPIRRYDTCQFGYGQKYRELSIARIGITSIGSIVKIEQMMNLSIPSIFQWSLHESTAQ